MRSRKFLLLAAIALGAAPGVRAQQAPPAPTQMPEAYKDVQMSQLRLQRRMLLAMIDSMPERLYRDKVTPVQRDFAQQVEHAAGALPMVAGMVLHVPGPTARMDSSQYLNSRAGMRQFVNGIYDWAEQTLRNQSAADRAQTINLFGTQMPGWKFWDEMHQHMIWTAGQMVANFRKNNMAPPGFGFF